VVTGHVVSTQVGADDMVSMVAAAFGIAHDASKAVLLNKIEHFLRACHKQRKRALLFVDEAQNLPPSSVEELRMLSNFIQDDKALLQSFILAQPEFRKTLQSPSMEQLRQRIIATCHLEAMNASETESYIRYRLEVAGWKNDPSFSKDAFAAIHDYSGGIPRKINLLCDRLLLVGWMDEKHALTGADVAQVVDDLRKEFGAIELGQG
jgi:type II secretory pathway predicted ATPase ExeA